MPSVATGTVRSQTALERACDSVAKLFAASRATFIEFVSDRTSRTVAAESHFGNPTSATPGYFPCILLEEEAFQAGRMIFVPDVTREPKLSEISSQLADAGIASLLYLPIKNGSGRTSGVVRLAWNTTCTSSLAGDDVRCEMASFLFHFISEARHLHEANEYRHLLLERLDRFAGHLHEVRDIQKLLVDIPRLAAELVEANVACLYEHHAALESLQRCAEYGYSGFPLNVSRADPHVLAQAASSGSSCHSAVYQAGYPAGIRTVLAVPIKYLGQVRYVLSVGFAEAQVTFLDSMIDALERYSARAWQAVASALRYDPDSEWHQHSALLNQLSTFMQRERDSEGAQHLMLHALLTGVTACFGLRFNRACVFLFEEQDEILVHQLSIGQVDWCSWQEVCQLNRKLGLDDVTTYLAAASANTLDAAELDGVMKDCRWQIGQDNDVISRVFRTGRPEVVGGSAIPSPLLELLKSTGDVAVVPLRWAAQSVGIMIADNEFSRCPITNPELETLCVFASTAAINLESLRLHRRRIEAEDRLRALLNTANTYERYGGTQESLKSLALATCVATRAVGARVILSADRRKPWLEVPVGSESSLGKESIMRPSGISNRVMSSGSAEAFRNLSARRDELNSKLLAANYRSAICLPLNIRDQCIGVMWLFYDRSQAFSRQDVEDLQTHANNVALIHDGAHRNAELDSLREAALAMSQPDRLEAEIQRVPSDALHLTDGDRATFWPYSNSATLLGDPVSAGENLSVFQSPDESLCQLVFANSYVASHGTDLPSFLAVQYLEQMHGFSAFQAVCVRVGHEPVGLLFIFYRQPCWFGDENKRQLQSFAAINAPLLKAELVLRQRAQFNDAANRAARNSAAGDLDRTLQDIVHSIRQLYSCGPVLLYLLEPLSRNAYLPPTMEGVVNERAVETEDGLALEAILPVILDRDKPYVAETISGQVSANSATLFDGLSFAQRETVRSCAALPLKAAHHELGVLFVNHHNPHVFTDDELAGLEFFAAHAALAILPAYLTKLNSIALNNAIHDLESPWTHVKRTIEFTTREVYGPVTVRQKSECELALKRIGMGYRAMRRYDALFKVATRNVRRVLFDVNNSITELANEFGSLLDRDVDFEYSPAGRLPITMHSDPSLLEAILINLLMNAEKYTKAGTIRLGCRLDGVRLLISVRDTGIGIPVAERELIFRSGFRGSNAQAYAGSGFGLFISRQCATALGGSLSLAVTNEIGSTFLLGVPLNHIEP